VFDGSVGGYTDFLEKPFTADGLLDRVRAALSATEAVRLL
jgi:FixJ family two-component response regulator